MKRTLIFLLAVLFALAFSAQAETETKREVLYYYENYCESCTPEEDFAQYFRSLTGLDLADCDYSAYNVVKTAGRQALDEAVKRFGLTNTALPMVIVDGTAYNGASQMEEKLVKTSLTWGTVTDSVIVYLYVPACESCARAVSVLDALPDAVSIKRGSVEIESKVLVEKIDISAQPEIAQGLFDAYAVSDDQRVSPIVFFADRYLSGADAIEKNLLNMVRLGWAAGGVNLPETPGESAENALSLTGTIGAGLIAGFNTCALSMLLLFLSLILKTQKNAGLLAALFLGAKFVCYLLIGFVLLKTLQRLNPLWLQPLARGILTALGLALVALNLWDAWQARRENYGKIRNQLPALLRGKLHSVIRTLTGTKALAPAAVALGFLVALGEFLCAGQLFLMQLLASAGSGSSYRALGVVVYSIAFIAPSAVLCFFVLKGQSHMRISAFLLNHMATAKIITAVMMLVLIAAAWLL